MTKPQRKLASVKEEQKPLERPRDESGLFVSANGGFTPLELTDFDLDVLRLLPNEGAKKGRYMPDVLSVGQIRKALDQSLTPDWIATRLKLMRHSGHVVRIALTSRTGGWQATEKGKKAVQ